MGTSLGVADTMALIASKLASHHPVGRLRAVRAGRRHGELLCRFAIGVDAPSSCGGACASAKGLRAGSRSTGARSSTPARASSSKLPASRRQPTIQSAIVCPLELGDRFIGTLALYHTEPGRYTEDHRRLLARVAEQAAAVVNNSLVFEQTQEESLTDPLTGLPNRRSMMARLSSEISRSERATASWR